MVKEPPKNTGQIPVPAPVAGQITELLVGPGQLLQAGSTQCYTISDMSTVWVLVNVYQSDMAYVRIGDNVEITTDSYPTPSTEKFRISQTRSIRTRALYRRASLRRILNTN